MSENKKAEQSAYEQQESRLSAQSAAFIKLLTQRGILGDADIDDDKIRQVQKDKKRRTYHNTEMLLQNYRSIVWALECFPTTNIREKENEPSIPATGMAVLRQQYVLVEAIQTWISSLNIA